MGLTITASSAAEAPDIEDGVYPARFDGVSIKDHPDWAGTNKFGKADDGRRFHFVFTVFEGDEPMYDDGEPLELEAVTNMATGERSNTAAVLKGLLTAPEFQAYLAGTGINEDDIAGRMVLVEVGHSEKGWPKITNVMAAPKASSKKAHTPPAQAAS